MLLLRPWQHALQVVALQSSTSRGSEAHGAKGPTTGKEAHGTNSVGQSEDGKQKETSANTTTGDAGKPEETAASFDAQARKVVEMRNRLRDARQDVSEDAKDWIRDKRDDMDDMREVCCPT